MSAAGAFSPPRVPWQIYQRVGSYANAKSSLYRFEVRVTHGAVATQMLESANRREVMQQLVQGV